MAAWVPGDPEYRAFVGPFEQYDVMGATQFALLYALGLRQTNRLLDIGCGSLRAGRMIIAYLEPGRFTGIEPNTWLIEAAVAEQLGQDLIAIKEPVFRAADSFDVSGLGTFDFVLAQSIASHTGPRLVPKLLAGVRNALGVRGLAAVTFIHADPQDRDYVHVEPNDEAAIDWLYPGCYSYRHEVTAQFVAEAGLFGRPIPWFHPRQTWWLLALDARVLPPPSFLRQLKGVSLAEGFEGSWRRPEDLPGAGEDFARAAYHCLPVPVRARAGKALEAIRRMRERRLP
jgi:SAM-dependent methyltransferase